MNSGSSQENIFLAAMIRGAIFDADGTLLDSMHIWHELGERYLKTRNIEPEEGLSRRLYPLSLEQGCEYLREHYGLSSSLKEIERGILAIIEGFYRDEAGIKPGVREFLDGLRQKNIPMVIATSGDRELLAAALTRNGIAEYFGAVFTCGELNTTKHEAKIFMACAEFMGLEPGNVAVFEDALFALETAKEAGFITFGVEDASAIHDRERIKALSDYYIESFRGGIQE